MKTDSFFTLAQQITGTPKDPYDQLIEAAKLALEALETAAFENKAYTQEAAQKRVDAKRALRRAIRDATDCGICGDNHLANGIRGECK